MGGGTQWGRVGQDNRTTGAVSLLTLNRYNCSEVLERPRRTPQFYGYHRLGCHEAKWSTALSEGQDCCCHCAVTPLDRASSLLGWCPLLDHQSDLWLLVYMEAPSTMCPLQQLTEPRPVHLSQGVSHARLVAQEGCEVHRLFGVIPRPRLHFASVSMAPLVGQEAQVPMPRGRELPVGLGTGRRSSEPRSPWGW